VYRTGQCVLQIGVLAPEGVWQAVLAAIVRHIDGRLKIIVLRHTHRVQPYGLHLMVVEAVHGVVHGVDPFGTIVQQCARRPGRKQIPRGAGKALCEFLDSERAYIFQCQPRLPSDLPIRLQPYQAVALGEVGRALAMHPSRAAAPACYRRIYRTGGGPDGVCRGSHRRSCKAGPGGLAARP
jgi:hypothetical protein